MATCSILFLKIGPNSFVNYIVDDNLADKQKVGKNFLHFMKSSISLLSMASSKKRPNCDSNHADSAKPAKKGLWSQGLFQSMDDPALFIEKDDKIVIIKDKYPKARHHFLVLPHENIPTLKSLTSSHVELLKYMHKKGKELTKKYSNTEFRYGYHAIPSMSQIHLHVISQDYDSPCLKSKKHWNSFTTAYFIDSKVMIQSLEEKGRIVPISSASGKELLNTPLKCHKCSFEPTNMPKLKQHLLEHIK